jgi:anthranilate synthase component 2
MKLLVLDNYDSFTYNLVHYIESILKQEVIVKRNDEIAIEMIASFSHIVLSPGPGVPKNAGIMPELLKRYSHTKKILGICLGHQAIIENFGGKIHNLNTVYHGVASEIKINNRAAVFKNLPDKLSVGRYHSWAAFEAEIPVELQSIAHAEEINMGVQHKNYAITGLQFHPESVLTPYGFQIIKNWLLESSTLKNI